MRISLLMKMRLKRRKIMEKGKKKSIAKKGVAVFGIFMIVIFMLAVGNYFYQFLKNKEKRISFRIGQDAVRLQKSYGISNRILSYVDFAAKIAIERAAAIAFNSQITEKIRYGNDLDTDNSCESYFGFSVLDFKGCIISQEAFEKAIESNFNNIIKGYLKALPELSETDFGYELYFDNSGKKTKVVGFSTRPIYIEESTYSRQIGNIEKDKQNKIIKRKNCESNDCIAELAKFYAKEYDSLPYVWGGESPYGYEETIKDQEENEDSIFKGVSVTKTQPCSQRASKRCNKPTVPGFDCSGFVWWVLRNGEVIKSRLNANGYYLYAQKNWKKVCDGNCDLETLKETAEPGDILFINKLKSGKIGHIAIYTGYMTLAESAGDVGVELRRVPERYYPGNSKAIYAIYRVFSKDNEKEETEKREENSKKQENSKKKSAEKTEPQDYDIEDNSNMDFYIRPDFSIETSKMPDFKEINDKLFKFYEDAKKCKTRSCVYKEIRKNNLECDKAYNYAFELLSCYENKEEDCLCRPDFSESPDSISIKKEKGNSILKIKSMNNEKEDIVIEPGFSAYFKGDNENCNRIKEATLKKTGKGYNIVASDENGKEKELEPGFILKLDKGLCFIANKDIENKNPGYKECRQEKALFPLCLKTETYVLKENKKDSHDSISSYSYEKGILKIAIRLEQPLS